MKKVTQILTLLLLLTCSLIPVDAIGQVQTYTTPATDTQITVPAGVPAMTVEVWGAGGRGGSRSSNGRGGGGGGGGYSRTLITNPAGNTYQFTVGAGSNSTSPGEQSNFRRMDGTVLALANGGNSVNLNVTGGAAGGALGVGDVRYTGGVGGGVSSTRSGGGGSSAGTASNGANASNNNGGNAPTGGGDGADGVSGGNNGVNGSNPGGGGSGANRTNSGGSNGGRGGNGQVRITYHYPEINITGNGFTIVDGDVTPITGDLTEFGNTSVSIGTITRTFVIQNLSNYTLNISSYSINHIVGTDFAFGTPPPASVPANGSANFTVVFNPSASGFRTATVVINSDDFDEAEYNFMIRGYGRDPEIGIFGNGVSIVNNSITPSLSDNTDYGSVSVDGGSTTVTYTIQNTGVGNLVISGISITGADASQFSIPAATYPFNIAENASRTFDITFNPSTIGYKNATVQILNDDSDENPFRFAIRGLGVRTYPDTDNDNISDNFDLDDDNDGILDTAEQQACVNTGMSSTVETIFLNETFGAGPTRGRININIPGASCTYCYEDGIVQANYGACNYQYLSSLNDGEYVVINSIADHGWSAPEDHTPDDFYGRMAVFNASYETGTFYETQITGVMPNSPITYSFWVLNVMPKVNYPGSIRPNITVEFLDTNGNVISTFDTGNVGRCGTTGDTDNDCDVSQWRQYTTTVNLGSVTTFTIRFKNNAPGGSGNDLAIDDIVIRQMYCDRDGDGIADIFDLDSDNDGIPDVEEAGFRTLTVGRGEINQASGWADANNNGVHDTIDAMIAGGTYSLPDTDGDGVRNNLDLDSDNDSWFDVDEAGVFNGDGDINGDGFGDGPDTDRDGILDLFDTFVGRGTNVRPFAQNTDGLGNPDYMQLDSDNDGVFDIASSLYANLDANNDGRIDGGVDADKDGIPDSFDTNTTAMGSPRNLDQKLYMDFDGRNDYGEAIGVMSNLAQATLMAWIKTPADAPASGFVVGQGDFGFRVTNTSGLQLRAHGKNATLTYGNLLPDTWYHIAMVHNGSATGSNPRTLLYVNGRLEASDNSAASSGPLPANIDKLTFGRHQSGSEYFKGSIEEVRVFNRPLVADQIQKMVYQEIRQQGTNGVRGEIVPKVVEGAVWNSLLAYYRMDAYKDDVIDSYLSAGIDDNATASPAKIYNIKQIRRQTAPMPFVTTIDGGLDAAVSQNNFVNPADIYTYDWSIVQVKNNVTVPVNDTSLGMFVDPGKTLVASNDNLIGNSWYLKLDGMIDLQGRSQLLQTATSDLDETSAGGIERDQQGTTNRFNYNYWASPVGPFNATTNNNNYTVAGVMKDGTNPSNPQNIQWTTGLNGSATSPITLSSYWIFKFENVSNNYSNWATVGPNGALRPGLGFTLKGSNAALPKQNFVFVGKPNNGNITLPITANNLYLTGNPYPSAIDANQFITDNTARITGALYFWEHFSTNTSHNLLQYQGGYATYTMVGGTPPVAPAGISGLGTSSRTPGRYIPVGQGFFVEAKPAGTGTLTYRNAQRAFRRETDAGSNEMFKADDEKASVAALPDSSQTDNYKRIRLGFNSYNNYHRQILLGFMEEHATSGIDIGYDAPHFDDQPNDMYFAKPQGPFNILGEGYFDETASFPLSIKCYMAGTVQFTLDAMENFENDQPVYIFDNVTGLYHDIRTQPFSIHMPNGQHNNRFSLRFLSTSLSNEEQVLATGIQVVHTQQDEMLNVRNQTVDATVETLTLFNILGQQVNAWEVADMDQLNIRVPVVNLAAGTYIVKVKTDQGEITRKIAVN